MAHGHVPERHKYILYLDHVCNRIHLKMLSFHSPKAGRLFLSSHILCLNISNLKEQGTVPRRKVNIELLSFGYLAMIILITDIRNLVNCLC